MERAPENSPETRSPEQEALAKVRDWIHDPKLKFHFSDRSHLKDILEKGILSAKFAKRIGTTLDWNMGRRGGASVSVADRERKIDYEGKELTDCLGQNIEAKDWWLTKFIKDFGPVGYIGFLLPDDLAVRDEEDPWMNESLAPIRIRPQKIEGLFISDSPAINNLDFFEHYAKKYRLPLYAINEKREVRLLWPKVQ